MSITRRGLIGSSALAWALSEITGNGNQVLDSTDPAALAADDGELVFVGPTRDPVRIKVSPREEGRFAMITQDVAPGGAIPLHLHEREDEIIFIQHGTGTATLADATVPLASGSMLYVPQGTWHGGENTGADVMKWIAIYSPSGFEGYFREIGLAPDADEGPRFTAESFAELNRRYGIRYPG